MTLSGALLASVPWATVKGHISLGVSFCHCVFETWVRIGGFDSFAQAARASAAAFTATATRIPILKFELRSAMQL